MQIDAKAWRILKACYWKSEWRRQPGLAAADAAYLDQVGLRRDVVALPHDQLIAEIRAMAAEFRPRDALALLSRSLPTRNLADRSLIATLLQARSMPEHSARGECPLCGAGRSGPGIDLGVLTFEKLMWGGVRLTDPQYLWADLTLHRRFPDTQGGSDDLRDLRDLLAKMSATPNDLSATRTTKELPLAEANGYERSTLCDILGICDVLVHPRQRGFVERYTPFNQRPDPPQESERTWPFSWYSGRYGVNLAALDKIMAM